MGGTFLGGAADGQIFYWRGGRGADFKGLYYQSRSDCTRPEAVMGVGTGGGRPLPLRRSGGITPEIFLFVSVRMCIFEC